MSCWVQPDAAWFRRIEAGWKQFDEDLAAYQPSADAPVPVAAPIEGLPALTIRVEGRVLATNLDAFKTKAMDFIGKIKTDLSTDQDFADADNMGKFLKDGEDRLVLAKEQALAQTASIDELFRTIDLIRDEMRAKRLTLERLVKSRKDQIRVEIQAFGEADLAAHAAVLNERIGKTYMPVVRGEFAGAMKGLKTITSLRDAVSTELARAKIAANEIADRIQINLNTLRDLATDYRFLFADTASIVLKNNDDLTALVKLRIAEHRRLRSGRLLPNGRGSSARQRHKTRRRSYRPPAGWRRRPAEGITKGRWCQQSLRMMAGGRNRRQQWLGARQRRLRGPRRLTARTRQRPRTTPDRPGGGVIGTMPNPTDADLADPIFKAIWKRDEHLGRKCPEHYVGYCGMNGSHVMLILNAIRAIKPAAKTKPRK